MSNQNFTATIHDHPRPAIISLVLPTSTTTNHNFTSSTHNHPYPWLTTLLKNEVFQSYFSMTLHILIEMYFKCISSETAGFGIRHGLWDMGYEACVHAITHANQEKGNLDRWWKARHKLKLHGLILPVQNSK